VVVDHELTAQMHRNLERSRAPLLAWAGIGLVAVDSMLQVCPVVVLVASLFDQSTAEGLVEQIRRGASEAAYLKVGDSSRE